MAATTPKTSAFPARLVAARFDVYRFDGQQWYLNRSVRSRAEADERAKDLRKCGRCTRVAIVETRGQVIAEF